MCESLSLGGFNGTVTNGKEVFVITVEMCTGFLVNVIRCGLEKLGMRNPDHGKYAVEHFLKMIL